MSSIGLAVENLKIGADSVARTANPEHHVTPNLNGGDPEAGKMRSPYAHLCTGNDEWDAFERTLPPRPINSVQRPTIEQMRESSNKQAQMKIERLPGPQSGLSVEQLVISVNDAEIPIRTYIPASDAPELFPLIVWFHGGGFCLGNLDTDDGLCRTMCVETRCAVVNVDYRLAPEFPFPHSIMDSYEATKWAISHASELRVNLHSGIYVGGISSGGSIASVMSLLARDDYFFKAHPIRGQMLLVPTTCAQEAFPEQYQHLLQSRWDINTMSLDNNTIEQFRKCYAKPIGHDPWDLRISPMIAPSHARLPLAHFQIAGNDPLRDEGIVYELLLRESGVPTKMELYPGLPHSFANFPHLKSTQKWTRDLIGGIEWLKSLNVGSTSCESDEPIKSSWKDRISIFVSQFVFST